MRSVKTFPRTAEDAFVVDMGAGGRILGVLRGKRFGKPSFNGVPGTRCNCCGFDGEASHTFGMLERSFIEEDDSRFMGEASTAEDDFEISGEKSAPKGVGNGGFTEGFMGVCSPFCSSRCPSTDLEMFDILHCE